MQQAKMMLKQKTKKEAAGKSRSSKIKTTKKRVGKVVKENTPVQLNFRPRTPTDDAFILQLTKKQLGEIHQQAFGQPFPEGQFLHYLQSGAPTYVIESGKHTIGYYSYLVGPDQRMHISALVIEPKHQSSGVGTRVMQQLETDAKSRGVQTLEVYVQEQNATSLAFTRSLGFVEVYRVTPNTICFQKQIG